MQLTEKQHIAFIKSYLEKARTTCPHQRGDLQNLLCVLCEKSSVSSVVKK